MKLVIAMAIALVKNRNRLKMGTIPKIPVTKKGTTKVIPFF